MEDVREKVEGKIKGKTVMVFSKSFCPYCKKTKTIFNNMIARKELNRKDYEVWDYENDPDSTKIRKVLKDMTKSTSVPRVFVNGKCIGGGNETEALDKKGKLKEMIDGATGSAGSTQQAQHYRKT